jgi:hypothetical protein
MQNSRNITTKLFIIVAIFGVTGLGATAPAEAVIASSCGQNSARQTTADDVSALTECPEGAVVIADGHGAGRIALPAPGMAVEFSAVTVVGTPEVPNFAGYRSVSGEVATLSEANGIETVNGNPSIIEEFDSLTTQVFVTLATNPKCDSYAYSTAGQRWLTSVQWYYKTPSFGGVSRVFDAMSAMSNGLGGCGANLSNSAAHSYQGTTTISANMSGGACLSSDYINVVDSANVLASASTLAQTCVYKTTSEIVHADMRINGSYTWYTSDSVTGCTGSKYDLEGVMTHEAGHLFGLGHVSTSTLQAMKPSSSTCETSQRNLGNGDLAGMKFLYP